jgi:hypothetical protein
MTPHLVGRACQSLQVLRDRLMVVTHGKREVWIVGLGGATTGPLVHHEVAAMGFDGRLESIHRLDNVEQVLRSLCSGQANPERCESVGQLS